MLIRVYVLLFLVGSFSVVGGVIVNNICEIRPVMCNRTIEILIHIMDQMSHDANSLEITWVVVWKAQIYTPGATAFRGRI
uniref:Putative secreted protein ovary overexpressed n=1 Tax=Rhipicephalus microplus TaxID=6941 RepID=A0A6M2DCB5_RHIMP